MGYLWGDLYGVHMTAIQYKVSNTMVAGQVVMREPTATDQGEVQDPTTTAALNCFGCSLDGAVTFSTVQGDPEGLVRLLPAPFGIWAFPISGGATANTAWPTAAPAIILTNTLASAGGTLVTGNVGTINKEGGILKGRTGANAGVTRKEAAHVDNTSAAVTVPFPNAIAVDDTFLTSPYSRVGLAMQLTTNLVQANGIIATGTGIPVMVHDQVLDEVNDVGQVMVVFRTHYHNSLA